MHFPRCRTGCHPRGPQCADPAAQYKKAGCYLTIALYARSTALSGSSSSVIRSFPVQTLYLVRGSFAVSASSSFLASLFGCGCFTLSGVFYVVPLIPSQKL